MAATNTPGRLWPAMLALSIQAGNRGLHSINHSWSCSSRIHSISPPPHQEMLWQKCAKEEAMAGGSDSTRPLHVFPSGVVLSLVIAIESKRRPFHAANAIE